MKQFDTITCMSDAESPKYGFGAMFSGEKFNIELRQADPLEIVQMWKETKPQLLPRHQPQYIQPTNAPGNVDVGWDASVNYNVPIRLGGRLSIVGSILSHIGLPDSELEEDERDESGDIDHVPSTEVGIEYTPMSVLAAKALGIPLLQLHLAQEMSGNGAIADLERAGDALIQPDRFLGKHTDDILEFGRVIDGYTLDQWKDIVRKIKRFWNQTSEAHNLPYRTNIPVWENPVKYYGQSLEVEQEFLKGLEVPIANDQNGVIRWATLRATHTAIHYATHPYNVYPLGHIKLIERATAAAVYKIQSNNNGSTMMNKEMGFEPK